MAKSIKKNNKSVKKNVYLNGGQTSSLVETTENTFPSVTSNSSLMSEWANYRPTSNIKNVDNTGAIVGGALQGGLSGAATGAAIGSVVPGVGTAIGAALGFAGSLFGGLSKDRKQRKEVAEANKKISHDNAYKEASLMNSINNSGSRQALAIESNYFQEGGPLHALGAEFPNGVSHVREGGQHHENPMGGVQVGIGQNGLPNLLEEGEVKFNDYVFSNSLKPDDELLEGLNLKESLKNKTFAEIASKLSKESEERPNDPISKRGLYSSMAKLTIAQELYKEQNNLNNVPSQGNLFEGGGDAKSKFDTPQWGSYGWDVQAAHDRATGTGFIDNSPQPQKDPQGDIQVEAPIPVESRMPETSGGPSWAGMGSALRYAPILGSALSVAGDMFGWQNTKDYTHANTLNVDPISFNPVHNYMTYNPLDTNYYSNQLRSAAGATRSAIANQSGGNRATATAGMLAADYNAMGHLGALNRQAEEQNLAQRMQVEAFNNQVNMYNSEGQLKTDMFNAERDYTSRFHKAQLKEQIDSQISQARSQNLTNLFDNLGDLGRESMAREMTNIPGLRYGIFGQGKIKHKDSNEKKNGGRLMTQF